MQTTPAGYETAWANRSTPTVEVTLDGLSASSSGQQVRKVTVRRELVGDLPDQASFLGGEVASSATLEMDGPLSTRHPLVDPLSIIAQQVKVRAGFGGAGGMVDVFTGTTRTGAFGQASKSQQRGAIDGADLLTAPVTLPAFGSIFRKSDSRYLRYPTNLSAVVVAALHASGIRVTPTPPTGTVVSLPLVGGMLADIGAPTAKGPGVAAGASWLSAGKWGACPNIPGAVVAGIPAVVAPWQTGTALLIEAWVYYSAQSADYKPFGALVNLNLGGFQIVVGGTAGGYPGRLWLQLVPDSGSVTPTTPPSGTPTLAAGWNRVAAQVSYSGAVQLWVGNTTWTGTPGWTMPATSLTVELWANMDGRVQAANLARNASTVSPSSISFTAQADVDTAALDVDAVPLTVGVEAWSLLKDIAAAEYGTVGFNESGRFQFRSRATIGASTTPAWTIPDYHAADLSGSLDTDSVRTRVTASLKRRRLIDSEYGSDALIAPRPTATLGSVVEIPAGQTVSLTLTSARPFVPRSAFVYQPTTETAAQSVDAGIVLMTSAYGSGTVVTSGISVGLSMASPTQAVITVTNFHGYSVYPVWPTSWANNGALGFVGGAPGAWILGYGMISDDDAETVALDVRNATSAATWGERVLDLDESVWRTDATAITSLANGILADLATPRAILDPIEVPADPRRQLGDVAVIPSDLGGATGRLVGLETTLSNDVEGKMTQTLTFRLLNVPLIPNAVGTAPVITTQPDTSDTYATIGDSYARTSAATGDPTPTVQWQRRQGTGGAWTDISGKTSASLSLTLNSANGFTSDGDWYIRAAWSNAAGTTYSNAARVNLTYP